MSNFDRTGPLGKGELTGRGRGPCRPSGYQPPFRSGNPSRGFGRGLGPGGGRGLGRLNQSRVSVGQPGPLFTYGPPR